MKRFCMIAGIVLVSAMSLHAQETVKDRKSYFPNRKSAVLTGKEIGILLTDGQPILSTEGRSGPADQLVFSAGGNSYRWVYVPTAENPLIRDLQVPVADGEKVKYPALDMANPKSVARWGVKQTYTLVEVEVNAGRGSPAIDSFVGTNFRVLDGSKEYPLNVMDSLKLVKDKYAEFITKQQKAIDQAMKDGAEKSLKGKAPTGPRERKDLMYLTWLPGSSELRVHFKTTISDGAYTVVNGPGGPRLPPGKLPPPPKGALFAAPDDTDPVLRIVPKNFAMKTGTTFGIEFGMAYVVNQKGEVTRTEELPIEPFTQQINQQVFQGGPGGRPMLPAPPVKD